jgi:Lon protease-like protein
MGDGPGEQFDPSAVPLFPLPNVVLFPRAILPLHIFEERYKAMTADALAGNRVIAMALLRPGWEKCYYGAPAIEPIVCAGKILTHERLPDGKYNFLLQGIARGRVVAEDRTRAYRVAKLELLPEADVMEIDLENERHRLTCMLSEGICANLPVVKQFRQMLTSTMPTAEIADLLAFNFIEDVRVKQSLLAENDPRRRVERLIPILDELRPVLESQVRRKMKSADSMN